MPRLAALLGTLLLAGAIAAGAGDWRLELHGGAARSFGSTLEVRQDGQGGLAVDASWAGRPFDPPIYWSWRVARWSGGRGFSLQVIHHKLYLEDPPPEIESFSVSHGYNLATLQYGWTIHGFELWAGGGAVIAHPESSVRGLVLSETGGTFGGGYHLTGPTLAVAAGRGIALGHRFLLSFEARFTASWARVPVAGGEAEVPDRSLHALVGLGFRF